MDRGNCNSGEMIAALSADERSSLLRRIVDSTLEAIVAHEPDGNLIYFSEGVCALLGYTRTEMESLGPFGWIGPESTSGAAERLEAILHGGELSFSSTAKRRDGSIVPTEVVAKRVDTVLGPLIVATIHDVSERDATQRELASLAFKDTLTGLANRAAFDERLGKAIADAVRHGDMLGLAYIDLDHFKPINDRFGHLVGDQVLIEVGARLVSCVRETDLVARLGGDEFVIILPRMKGAHEFAQIAHRLLDTIRQPIDACGTLCDIDASIGFSVFDAARDDARSLIVKADMAMYAAKRDAAHPWLQFDANMEFDS